MLDLVNTPRHVIWRRQYRERRYARHLSQCELNTRIRDILLNFLRVTPEAKIGFRPLNTETATALEKFTHMLEEMQLRHGPYPAGFSREILHSEPIPDFASDIAKKAAKKMSLIAIKGSDGFIKFGKRTYMEALYETGALRIQPAHCFHDPDLNAAIRDDELGISFSVALSRDDVVKLVVNKNDVPIDAPEQRVDVRFRWPSDFWLYCGTTSLEPRLFVDFDADACVIIHDRATFREMLRKASEPQLAGALMHDASAIYLDPVLPSSTDVFVPLVKHFRYTYQEEYRFFWLPPTPVPRVSCVDICVGSLQKIAELVFL